MRAFKPSFLLLISVLVVCSVALGKNIVDNLKFEADIYASANNETIEYLSDLELHSFGGFGVNAHVYRSRLRSGDEVAFAISADDTNAFALKVMPSSSSVITVTVPTTDYPFGTVTAIDSSTLHYTWEIKKNNVNIRLHRNVRLAFCPLLSAGYLIEETTVVENFGSAPLTVTGLSEYWHMDDRAQFRDFDNDGTYETLLAINNFSTTNYPVLGKAYANPSVITFLLRNGERFATVNHDLNQLIGSGQVEPISKAYYVTSTVKDSSAEQEVGVDVQIVASCNEATNVYLPIIIKDSP